MSAQYIAVAWDSSLGRSCGWIGIGSSTGEAFAALLESLRRELGELHELDRVTYAYEDDGAEYQIRLVRVGDDDE
jgi:hypothetical protein